MTAPTRIYAAVLFAAGLLIIAMTILMVGVVTHTHPVINVGAVGTVAATAVTALLGAWAHRTRVQQKLDQARSTDLVGRILAHDAATTAPPDTTVIRFDGGRRQPRESGS